MAVKDADDIAAAAAKQVLCSCCGMRLVDAIVEHVWFELSTSWLFVSRSPDSRVERVLAVFVAARIPIVARQLLERNRQRLLAMANDKQTSVVLELVARGMLT